MFFLLGGGWGKRREERNLTLHPLLFSPPCFLNFLPSCSICYLSNTIDGHWKNKLFFLISGDGPLTNILGTAPDLTKFSSIFKTSTKGDIHIRAPQVDSS